MLMLFKLHSTLDESKVKNLVAPLWCILRLAGVVLISVFFLSKQTLLNKSWPMLLPCYNSYIVGSPERPCGSSVFVWSHFWSKVLQKPNCRTEIYIPRTCRGLANACWCRASVLKNDVILLAELAQHWKLSWAKISLVSGSTIAL